MIKHLIKIRSVSAFVREAYPLHGCVGAKIAFNTEKHIFKKYPSTRRLSQDTAHREEPWLGRGMRQAPGLFLWPLKSVAHE